MNDLVVLSHVYNEELLISHWLKHHREIFDHGIIIDQGSTDSSVEIIRELCPSWEVYPSRLPHFDALHTDEEMMFYESSLLMRDYKMVLNTTEFIWAEDFRGTVETLFQEHPHLDALAMRSFCIVDRPPAKPLDPELPLWLGRTWGLEDRNFGTNVPRFHRFIHRREHGHYSPGRHSVDMPNALAEDLWLLWFGFSPWPQVKDRKMQIQNRIPISDKMMGRGIQHIQDDYTMEVTYQNWLRESGNLMEHPHYSKIYQSHIDRLT